MIDFKLDGNDVRRALKLMKEMDSKSVNRLRSNLRSNLKPIADQIAAAVPDENKVQNLMSGFVQHTGATRWAPMLGKVTMRTGKRRKGGPWSPLVSLQIGTKPDYFRGPYIAELAGTRSKGSTAQGKVMTRIWNFYQPTQGEAGRFIYPKFRLLKPDIVKRAESALKPLFDQLERSLR